MRRHLAGIGHSLSFAQTLSDQAYHAYHQDDQGSTAYITGIDGKTENSYLYDAFGNLLESQEAIENRILYTGQQYDQETGQYYLRVRYYNPVTSRMLSEDTYRGDGLNLYAYCSNNPVTYYDWSGHNQEKYNNGQVPPSESGARPDFYVTPDGNVVPATGYRYVSEDAPYLDDMQSSMTIPENSNGTYLSFDNYDTPNPRALQVPHDASVKVSFDTLQLADDINIPNGNWGKADYLEPITTDFPEFGPGGATQAVTTHEIKLDTIVKLPKE